MSWMVDRFIRLHPALAFVGVTSSCWVATPPIINLVDPAALAEPAPKTPKQPVPADGPKVASQGSLPSNYGTVRSNLAPAVPTWSVTQLVGTQAIRVRTIATAATVAAALAVKAELKAKVAAATRVGVHYYVMNQQTAKKAAHQQAARAESTSRSASRAFLSCAESTSQIRGCR